MLAGEDQKASWDVQRSLAGGINDGPGFASQLAQMVRSGHESSK
jgi:hypothetical protein